VETQESLEAVANGAFETLMLSDRSRSGALSASTNRSEHQQCGLLKMAIEKQQEVLVANWARTPRSHSRRNSERASPTTPAHVTAEINVCVAPNPSRTRNGLSSTLLEILQMLLAVRHRRVPQGRPRDQAKAMKSAR